jgi:hypothetical protein
LKSPAVYKLKDYLKLAGNTLKLLKFEFLTAVVMNSSISREIMPYSPFKTNVPEEYIASIFRVEE